MTPATDPRSAADTSHAANGAPHGRPHAAGAHGTGGSAPRGVQSVKFSFYRLHDDVRTASPDERRGLAETLRALLDESASRMLTRVYSTVGTRADTDFLVWQVHDDLEVIREWHASLLRSPLAAALERPRSYLSMTMRSIYTNPLHEGAGARDRLRADGGANTYLFVYPMAKTRAWYELPHEDRQRMMDEHIRVGHEWPDVKLNTTYSYGLDDQEFVVAFESDHPGRFLDLLMALRLTDAMLRRLDLCDRDYGFTVEMQIKALRAGARIVEIPVRRRRRAGGQSKVSGSLRGVVSAIAISRATMRNVYQNLFGAFVYNALGLPVALGVLYPVIGLLLSPILAALAMSFSSVTVISNANRLKRFKLAEVAA